MPLFALFNLQLLFSPPSVSYQILQSQFTQQLLFVLVQNSLFVQNYLDNWPLQLQNFLLPASHFGLHLIAIQLTTLLAISISKTTQLPSFHLFYLNTTHSYSLLLLQANPQTSNTLKTSLSLHQSINNSLSQPTYQLSIPNQSSITSLLPSTLNTLVFNHHLPTQQFSIPILHDHHQPSLSVNQPSPITYPAALNSTFLHKCVDEVVTSSLLLHHGKEPPFRV
jgi:hypothetical protein